PKYQRLVVFVAGPLMNIVLALLLVWLVLWVYGMEEVPESHWMVSEVLENSPAEASGVAVEIVVLMLLYIDQSLRRHRAAAAEEGRSFGAEDLRAAIVDGALMRVRPIMMTAMVIIAGLLPIMIGSGTGSEVMRRIAAPMVGGMASATILTLLVLPALYSLWRQRQLGHGRLPSPDAPQAEESV
ncbi:MAG: efflux RND transporter permease subunit, partial [Rhodothalassiaceae bacterium]